MYMVETISAKERPLKTIFSNDYAFTIPAYQRPYSWGTEQAEDLLADIRLAMEDDDGRCDVQDLSPYFLGSIVLIKAPESPEAQVVDGQQRLTTLTILLSVLREMAGGRDVADGLHEFICEVGNPLTGARDRFRLTPRPRDRAFFQSYIQDRGRFSALEALDTDLPEAQANMRTNALALHARLLELDQGERDRLAAFLLQRCYLVVVCASDQDSAFRIFSVMNDRGLDLSATDILKAEIIGALDEDEGVRSRYTAKWEEIEAELGAEEFEDLFSHIRMIHAKQKAQRALAVEFKEHVRPQDNPAAFVDRTLAPYADAYSTILDEALETSRQAERINALFGHLNRLDNFDWMPPALWFLARNRSAPDALLRYFTELERLSYGLFILRRNATERVQRFGRLLAGLEAGQDFTAPDSPMQLDQVERKQIISRLDGPFYTEKRIRLPVLLRLDGVLADHGVVHDPDIVTVEHVLPQNPADGSVWLDWFPDEEERAAWTHRIGNLALLSRRKNSQASNYDFTRKKSEYFMRRGVTTFALTTQIVSETTWTPEILATRQKKLIDTLAALWRLR